MPDAITKRCPQCGQRTTNLQLAECPYCQVALVTEGSAPTAALTREQAQAMTRHLLGLWKLWVAAVLLVALAAWGVVRVSQKIIDSRSKDYLGTLEETTSNRLAVASAQITRQLAKQIEAEVKQANLKSAIDQAARDGVNDALSNSMWPSLEEFRRALSKANAQLAKATNDLARLDRDIKAAERKATQAQAQLTQPAAAPVAATPAPATPPKTAPTSAGSGSKLTLASQTVSQNGANYILTAAFKQTGTNGIGSVTLFAGLLRQSGARIVGFGLISSGQSQPMALNDTQDAGQLTFNVAAGDLPVVGLEVSGPTIVQMTSDSLAQDLMLPVAADKLVSPSASR